MQLKQLNNNLAGLLNSSPTILTAVQAASAGIAATHAILFIWSSLFLAEAYRNLVESTRVTSAHMEQYKEISTKLNFTDKEMEQVKELQMGISVELQLFRNSPIQHHFLELATMATKCSMEFPSQMTPC
jgi:hypothetical protein